MAEGGIAEKFPDEWDLQFLGNTIIRLLASGIPPDFLIKRYIFSIYSIIKVLNFTTEVLNLLYI